MAKQIEDYPELMEFRKYSRWDAVTIHKNEYYAYGEQDVEEKLLSMQARIDELTEHNKEFKEMLNRQIVFSRNVHHFMFEKAGSIPDGVFYHLNKLLKELNKESK